MDLRQIMSFMSIHEERKFSRAAQRTGTVQPALSINNKLIASTVWYFLGSQKMTLA